jgi:hypothetical protein
VGFGGSGAVSGAGDGTAVAAGAGTSAGVSALRDGVGGPATSMVTATSGGSSGLSGEGSVTTRKASANA